MKQGDRAEVRMAIYLKIVLRLSDVLFKKLPTETVIPDWPAEHTGAPALDPVLHHVYRVKASATTTTHTVMNVATIEEVQMGGISSASDLSHQGPEVAERAQRTLLHLAEVTVVSATGPLLVVAVEVKIMSRQS